MRKLIFTILLICFNTSLYAQTNNVLLSRILRQVQLFPQEKTYIFTDAESYQAGQRIHLRVFLVNAVVHQTDSMSHYVYVELLNSEHLVVKRVRLIRSDQGFVGHIDIPEGVVKGRYLLRSYTKNMLNLSSYESLKSIFIGGQGKLLPCKYSKATNTIKGNTKLKLYINKLGNNIKVSIDNYSDSIKTDYRLFIHCRSVPIYFGKISKDKDVILSYDSLSQGGIYSFQLLDANLNTVEEKLKLIYPEKELCTISVKWIETEKTNDGQVPCIIKANNLREGETMDVSVRVEYGGTNLLDGQSNILSHLLYDMDVADRPEQPASILFNNESERLLDSCSWNRYRMADVIKGECKKGKISIEKSTVIRGRVETLIGHKPIKEGVVNLISPDKGFYAVTKTDAQGRFSFEGIDFPEGTQYVLNAFTKAGKSWVKLLLDEEEFPSYTGQLPPFEWIGNDTTRIDATLALPKGGIQMEEVNVFSHQPTYSSRSDAYARTADFSFGLRDIESIGATCLHELLRRVPSVRVELGKCYVRGGTAVDGKRPAAIAIDGIFLNDDYDLDNVQMSDVERVDVFKGGSTVIWGAIGGMGVISITTKKGDFKAASVPLTNTKTFTTLGYQIPQSYTPNAHTPVWLPSLRGSSFRLLLPSEYSSNYHIIIEGVTSEGRIIHYVGELGK
ncbi:TonB-dependent receptor plug domain-containing protein [Prevotella melaninogenica]|uniref:TonB-dependent receptor plug domain-containing protein n=1 Tax=Prevotella melaninogenica TaxID=28132 RepID=UPI001559F3CB|nr:TonB-dependent receptor plug domain-containing protein [Prevotella melaninogenica]